MMSLRLLRLRRFEATANFRVALLRNAAIFLLHYTVEVSESSPPTGCQGSSCDVVSTDCVTDESGDSFTCHCKRGFERLFNNSCEDVDECLSMGHECAISTSRCVNTVGGYQCECFPGYKQGKKPTLCRDIDECAHEKPVCEDPMRCMNTQGSYKCSCKRDYFQITSTSCLVKPSLTLAYLVSFILLLGSLVLLISSTLRTSDKDAFEDELQRVLMKKSSANVTRLIGEQLYIVTPPSETYK